MAEQLEDFDYFEGLTRCFLLRVDDEIRIDGVRLKIRAIQPSYSAESSMVFDLVDPRTDTAR